MATQINVLTRAPMPRMSLLVRADGDPGDARHRRQCRDGIAGIARTRKRRAPASASLPSGGSLFRRRAGSGGQPPRTALAVRLKFPTTGSVVPPGRLRVHPGSVQGVPRRLELEVVVTAPVGRALEDRADGAGRPEQAVEDVRRARDPLGEDARGASAEEARRVVLDALSSPRLGRVGRAPLGVARGVAQSVRMTTAFGAKILPDVVLAPILGVVVPVPGRPVQAEPVLGVLRERAVRAGPAIAVAEIDQDVRALGRRLDARPCRIRAVDLDDAWRRRSGPGRRAPGAVPVVGRARADGTDDDHDLRLPPRGRGVGGAGRGDQGDRRAMRSDGPTRMTPAGRRCWGTATVLPPIRRNIAW